MMNNTSFNGDCSLCRKRGYCKKQCKANREFFRGILYAKFVEAITQQRAKHENDEANKEKEEQSHE